MALIHTYHDFGDLGETIHVFSDHLSVVVPKQGFFSYMKASGLWRLAEGTYDFQIDDIEVYAVDDYGTWILKIATTSSKYKHKFTNHLNGEYRIWAKKNTKKHTCEEVCETILEAKNSYLKKKGIEYEKNLDFRTRQNKPIYFIGGMFFWLSLQIFVHFFSEKLSI